MTNPVQQRALNWSRAAEVCKVTKASHGSALYGFSGALPRHGGTTDATVFKLTKGGRLTTLNTFTVPPDGAGPGSLVKDSAGILCGTTAGGERF